MSVQAWLLPYTTFMRFSVATCSVVLAGLMATGIPVHTQSLDKLDLVLQQRAAHPIARSRVIVSPRSAPVDLLIQQLGGTLGRALPLVNGRVADIADTALPVLARSAIVARVALDRLTFGTAERTPAVIGASAVRQELGYDGRGVGVAVIDSGISAWQDDLGDPAIPGSQRVAQFVDFVGGSSAPYDDYGHGTHVAGIVAGNGWDSSGGRTGIAPAASLVVLKVLDSFGGGHISDVIAALDYVVTNRHLFNIRIVNLSVGASVYESYTSDLLAQAAKRAVEQGVVVVAAAGNNGRDAYGRTQHGSIIAPGNAPWVLTVGASSHMGTIDRADDTIASFSSRGPTRIDYAAKPDIVAPGVGIESLSDPQSRLYSTRSQYLLSGTVEMPYLPYLSMSGTSMAAPVVAGTVALMLQTNAGLTPNAVKAILQYTAEINPRYDALSEGAGFLNARGAVDLARYFADPSAFGGVYPSTPAWSGQIIWGNQRVAGGRLMPGVNAWSLSTSWGVTRGSGGENVVWGVTCTSGDCGDTGAWMEWRTSCNDPSCSSVAYGGHSDNVVWRSDCGGSDCSGTVWAHDDGSDGVVWGTSGSEMVVWGTAGDDEMVVWGTTCSQGECDSVIWPQ